jgi:uncharacterized membrane protein
MALSLLDGLLSELRAPRVAWRPAGHGVPEVRQRYDGERAGKRADDQEDPTMWRALALGVVTGMRSQLAAALLAWRQTRGDLPEPVEGPAGLLRRPQAVGTLMLAAAGELVADKLPQTPSRLDAGPFLGRLSLGATAGAGIAAAYGRSRLVGGALGLAGAALGSWAGARYRAVLAERSDAPDAVWAAAEDVAAITLGVIATRPPAA